MKPILKTVVIFLLISLTTIALAACAGSQGLQGAAGAAGPAGPQGQEGSAGPQGDSAAAGSAHTGAVMLNPSEAEAGRPEIMVIGSGWQTDEAVTIEVYGPNDYHVFIGGAVVDSSGTFEVEIRPRSRDTEGGPFAEGLHSVVVLGSKNGGASAALMITPEQ
jgi:hypothetical protein